MTEHILHAPKAERVLLVTFFYPPRIPLGSGGLQRVTRLVKHLPRLGWKPVILTSENSSGVAVDETVLERTEGSTVRRASALLSLPEDAGRLERIAHTLLLRTLLLPDERGGWLLPAVIEGLKTIRNERCAAMITTAPPHTSHLVGYVLKRLTGLPWIADFRDAWVSYQWRNPARLSTRVKSLVIDNWQERMVVREADCVVVVNNHMHKDLCTRYPELARHRFVVIENGYDADDYEGLCPESTSVFTITYTGSISPGQDIAPFLDAFRAVYEAARRKRKAVRLVFVGTLCHDAQQMLTAFQRGCSAIDIIGHVSHRDALRYQLSSDVLLYFAPRSTGKASIDLQNGGGKIAEYLASGRFILALAGPCAATELIAETGQGIAVAPSDVPAITEALERMLEMHSDGQLKWQPPGQAVTRLEWAHLAGRFARVLDRLLTAKRARVALTNG